MKPFISCLLVLFNQVAFSKRDSKIVGLVLIKFYLRSPCSFYALSKRDDYNLAFTDWRSRAKAEGMRQETLCYAHLPSSVIVRHLVPTVRLIIPRQYQHWSFTHCTLSVSLSVNSELSNETSNTEVRSNTAMLQELRIDEVEEGETVCWFVFLKRGTRKIQSSCLCSVWDFAVPLLQVFLSVFSKFGLELFVSVFLVLQENLDLRCHICVYGIGTVGSVFIVALLRTIA
jgi:hypothetical protein